MEKSFVTLMRHAKSSWQQSGQSDYDRPLNKRGMSDAPIMAQRLIEQHCVPDLIICSSAKRALETAAYLVDAFELDKDNFLVKPDLYLASPETILEILQSSIQSAKHTLLIAHNPGLEQLSSLLASESSSHLPTAGLRHFSWPKTDGGKVPELIFEDYPKNQIDQ